MNRLRGLLTQFEFHILVLVLGFICFWPLMSVFEKKHPVALLAYLFLIWIFLIALLFLMGRAISALDEAGREDRSRGSP